MTDQLFLMKDERMTAAITEMQHLISTAFPSASYTTAHQDDPEGIRLIAMVEIENTNAVFNCFIDRLLMLQVKESFPSSGLTSRCPSTFKFSASVGARVTFKVETC